MYYICSSFLTVIKFVVVITLLHNFFNFLYFVLLFLCTSHIKLNTVIIRVTCDHKRDHTCCDHSANIMCDQNL